MTSTGGQNLPALVMGSRKCQWDWSRLCFQGCLRPSSLVGSRIPVVCDGLLLAARWMLSGLWVVTPPWSWEGTKGPAHGAQLAVDGSGMCCPSLSSPRQGYKLLMQRGTKPWPSAAAGGWGDKAGSEGQAAHLQVSSFFSCLLCNVELWTSALPWRWRGAVSLLSPWELSPLPVSLTLSYQVRTPTCCYGLNLPFRLFLFISHPPSFLPGHQTQFCYEHILLDSCAFPCCPLLLSCLPECCYCT